MPAFIAETKNTIQVACPVRVACQFIPDIDAVRSNLNNGLVGDLLELGVLAVDTLAEDGLEL